MNKKVAIGFLVFSTIVLGGCNFFGLGGNKVDNGNGDEPEATPFQREYEQYQQSEDGNYQMDMANSTINWNARGANNIKYEGIMNFKSGEAGVEEGKFRTAETVVDVTSIKTQGNLTNVDTFLKAESYFSAQSNPEVTLKILSVESIVESPIDELNYEVEAEITIKGETKPLAFDAAIVVIGENIISFAAEIDVDLEDFGSPASTATSIVNNKFEMNVDMRFMKV